MQDPITVFDAVPDKARIGNLRRAFKDLYKQQATYIARAPGRVSIIGEHIDYAGLSVLPTAIDRDVLMACTASPSKASTSSIRIANVNSAKFPEETVSYLPGSDEPLLDPKAHSWVNYFKAGLKGVLAHLGPEKAAKPVEMLIMTDGNVPPGGGLSSSAAMVVASAIATLQAYNALAETTQGQLAEIAIESERLVGVNSGGMDQSASIFSKQNYLLNVGFVPKLVSTLVPFPSGEPALSYVIANTLVTSEKAKTAKYHYNLRVVEMRVAAALLAKYLNLKLGMDLPTPKHIMDAYFQEQRTHTSSEFLIERQRRLTIMLSIVEDLFGPHQDGYNWKEVYQSLDNISPEDFRQRFHPTFEIEADKLHLYKRAKHAYSEAKRVYQYRGLLERASEQQDEPALGEKLGQLMNDSQRSCRDLFECSCPEIDEVCEIARKAGSLGSRVSGAGWGGCTVHLVPRELLDSLIETLKREYYAKKYPDLSEEELGEAIFSTIPEEGANLYRLQ